MKSRHSSTILPSWEDQFLLLKIFVHTQPMMFFPRGGFASISQFTAKAGPSAATWMPRLRRAKSSLRTSKGVPESSLFKKGLTANNSQWFRNFWTPLQKHAVYLGRDENLPNSDNFTFHNLQSSFDSRPRERLPLNRCRLCFSGEYPCPCRINLI